MSVANPYFINIQLFWPGGTRPNQNQVARVNAYDVNGSVITWEGQSGYDPSNGGWQDIIMQNTAAFYPPRLHPNLRFEVISTQEQVLHTTQVFQEIVSDSTVKIIIGVSDQLVGQWVVSGSVKNQDNSPVTVGTVQVWDVTNGSQALVGTATPNGSGNYSVSFSASAFENNGTPHANPNLQVKYLNADGVLVAQSAIQTAATQQITINLVIGAVSQSGDYRVFGSVLNQLGLPVSDVLVEAVHLAWTTTGIEEVPLGKVMTGPKGAYEILYTPTGPQQTPNACNTPPGVVNLLVYAKAGSITAPGAELAKGPLISPVPRKQRVDLVVDQVSTTTGSEYLRVLNALSHCLGTDIAQQLTTLNSLRVRPEYFQFVAKASGTPATLLEAYVTAQVITAEINAKVPWGKAGTPYESFPTLAPEVVYGLVRRGGGKSLADLLKIQPKQFFNFIVSAAVRGTIQASFEQQLGAGAETPLQEQWALVLGFFLANESTLWQSQVLEIALPYYEFPGATTEDKQAAAALKRAEVSKLYYEHEGTFEEFLDGLLAEGVITNGAGDTPKQRDHMFFVFELYEAVDQYLPIVSTVASARQTQGWLTIADLAKVPLDGPYPSWVQFADIQKTGLLEVFPGDIPGRTAEEKVQVYARRLYEKFGGIEPEVRFVHKGLEAATSASDSILTDALEFVRDHEDFDLATTVVDTYLSENNISLSADVRAKVKQLQRVARITPDYEEAAALIVAGYDSAVSIAQVDEGDFVAEQEEALGLAEARRIHRTASYYAGEVFSNLVRFNQNLNEMGGLTAVPSAPNYDSLVESSPDGTKFPNWVTLFGGLNACKTRHCQTVLSPGAYFVDLLRFVDGAPKNLLLSRRPDLQDMELTCANTDRVLPYIDLVIEILGNAVASQQIPAQGQAGAGPFTVTLLTAASAEDPDLNARQTVFDILTAAGHPLTENVVIRPSESGTQRWVVVDDAWRFEISKVGGNLDGHLTAFAIPQTSERGGALEVFPEHSNPAANQKLASAIYPFQLPLELGREEAELIFERRGTSLSEVLETYRRGRSAASPDLSLVPILTSPAHARSYLQLTENEQNVILEVGAPLHEFWGFEFDTGTQITIPRPESPTIAVEGNWIELMGEMSIFLQRTQLTYDEVLELIDTQYVHGGGLKLYITAKEVQIQECDYGRFRIANTVPAQPEDLPLLSTGALRRIRFFLRLRRALGWDMRTLDRYLMLVERFEINTFTTGNQIPGDLIRVSQVVRLADELKLDVDEVLLLLQDLPTRRTERHPKSAFAEVYLRGAPDSGEFQALELLDQGQRTSLDIVSAQPETSQEGYLSYIRSALRLRAEDAEALWYEVVGQNQTLNVGALSQMARIALFCRANKLSIQEYLALFEHVDEEPQTDPGVLGLSVFPPLIPGDPASMGTRILAIFAAREEIVRIQKARLSAVQLDYLLRHNDQPGRSLGPAESDITTVMSSLSTAASGIQERYPVIESADAETVGGLLTEVLPQEKVPEVLSIFRSNAALTTAEQATLQWYFSVFLDPDVLLGQQSFIDGPESVRWRMLGDVLRPILVRRARVDAALSTAAEVTGGSADTIDRLLNDLLSSVADPASPALVDWLGGLSAFSVEGGGAVDAIQAAGAGTYATRWVVPADGTYQLVVRGVPDTTIPTPFDPNQLVIKRGVDPITAPVLTGDVRDLGGGVFDIVHALAAPLKAGELVPLIVEYGGTAPITLSTQLGIESPRLLTGAEASAFNADALVKLHKALLLAGSMRLRSNELAYLASLTDPNRKKLLDRLPLAAGAPLAWSEVRWFVDQVALNRDFRLDGTTLFDEWTSEEGLTAERVEVLTGFRSEDVTMLLETLWSVDPEDPETNPSLNAAETWFVLSRALQLLQKLDVPLAQVLAFDVGEAPAVRQAEALRNSLRANYTDDAWSDVFKPLRDKLRQKHRDGLVGYLTTQEIPLPSGTKRFVDENDLFGHFLIDVEMEPDTLLSRLKLGLNTIQLFVQRAFMGLEGARVLPALERKREQWSWMKNYRVWEANRKVFLYPENWIEPELRDDKTELFKTLEEELLQDEVTDERARTILSNYVEGLDEVANLVIVGAVTEGRFSNGTTSVLHIVGRTRSLPYTYYHRTFEEKQFSDGVFTPWRRVPLEIATSQVAPVVREGALYLFWPLYVEKGATSETPPAHPIVEIRMMWSGLVPETGRWTKPQKSSQRVIDHNPVQSTQRDSREDGPITRFYHFKTGAQANGQVNIQVIKTLDPALEAAPPLPEPLDFSDLEQVDVPPDPAKLFPKAFLPLIEETPAYKERLEDREEALQDLAEQNLEVVTRIVEYQAAYNAAVQWRPSLGPHHIGTFHLSPIGEEAVTAASAVLMLNDTVPRGAELAENAALKMNHAIDGQAAGTSFGFRNSTAYFQRVPSSFRSLVSNFGYTGDNLFEPFFVETPAVSLFAVHRGASREAGLTPELSQGALFTTFNHAVLPQIKAVLRAQGAEGIMQRLVQALPTSDGRYYYNYSSSYLSPGAGGYTSGYNNKYNYYGGLYLGYELAGDTMALGVAQRDFELAYAPDIHQVERPLPMPTVQFRYGQSYGIYNWELFFHLPLLIADRLSQEMRYEEALNWYHFIFDPRNDLNPYEKTRRFVDSLPHGSRYWNFLPFFANKDADASLQEVFGATDSLTTEERESLSKLIADWRENPFNPHLIARQRIVAYQKTTVMKYLDNLIAWADQLFRQDTFESINEATQLYVIAAEIMGRRPEVVEDIIETPRYTYRELKANDLSDFSNALVEAESRMVAYSPHVKETPDRSSSANEQIRNIAVQSLFFRIPRNSKLDSYWDTVADRLFKIRNSMNIDGVKRALALFEPPIDPALLVKAAAQGIDLSTVLAQLNQPKPHYRFRVWIQKAMDLVNEVKSFGGALLSALEKKDAEELSRLRQGQELELLRLTTKIREEQIKEAEENIVALEASRVIAEQRQQNYSRRQFMSGTEKAAMVLNTTSDGFNVASGVMSTIAGAVGVVPQVHQGVGTPTLEFGGKHLSSVFEAIASGLGATATSVRLAGTLAGTIAGYQRRQEDWDLQEEQAKLEVAQIDQQITAAQVRLEIARKELSNHEVQIEQSEEVQTFLQDKFTNLELYRWMSTELQKTYRQSYNLAYDVAKTAEATFQFELGTPDASFIQFNYMESVYKGLLAGEKLGHDIKRMDIAYLQRDKREFEITKPISLAQLNPMALQDLRAQGWCEFSLPEVLFDLDFPGQYFRRIRAVRLTIPCVTGPYTSVSAKLSLLNSAIRTKSTANATDPEDYPYKGFNDERFAHNFGGIQSIATSTAQDDAGLFELNFKDERYLPFEGQGVVSTWRLELPQGARQFDYHTISDVVVNVSYTARDAGGTLTSAVNASLESGLNNLLEVIVEEGSGLARVFSMKREFPDALHQLLSSGSATIKILPEHFPYLIRDKGYALTHATEGAVPTHIVTKRTPSNVPHLQLGLVGGATNLLIEFSDEPHPNVRSADLTRDTNNLDLLYDWQPEEWVITQSMGVDGPEVGPADVDDILFELKYTVPVQA